MLEQIKGLRIMLVSILQLFRLNAIKAIRELKGCYVSILQLFRLNLIALLEYYFLFQGFNTPIVSVK